MSTQNSSSTTATKTTGNNSQPSNVVSASIKAMRPRQWVKNILVVAAPLAAGFDAFSEPKRAALDILIAFVAFCMASSSIYLINDARDVEADRQHPTKRYRPIASGALPVNLAYAEAVILMLAALGISLLASHGTGLAMVIGVYLVLQLGYCFGWKNIPVIDIALVSSGFILRCIAGGVAVGIELSQWFLMVVAFGSLFMAAGKRYAEFLLAEQTGAKIRKSLQGYTATYLRFVWTLSATAMVIAYASWGFEQSNIADDPAISVWYQISCVPFILAVLRFALDVDRGEGGAPDEIALKDRTLQVLAVLWVITIGLAVYIIPSIA